MTTILIVAAVVAVLYILYRRGQKAPFKEIKHSIYCLGVVPAEGILTAASIIKESIARNGGPGSGDFPLAPNTTQKLTRGLEQWLKYVWQSSNGDRITLVWYVFQGAGKALRTEKGGVGKANDICELNFGIYPKEAGVPWADKATKEAGQEIRDFLRSQNIDLTEGDKYNYK